MNKEENYRFNVKFFKEAVDFLDKLDYKSREKVLENIRISRFKIDTKLLKKVNKDIWEFRTKSKSVQIRLLAFWDKESKSLIVCTHGFIKKSQKIPTKELNKAKRLRIKYLDKMKGK